MKKQYLANLGLVLVCVCSPYRSGFLSAEIKLPKVISDHAVLQRNAPIHIWGWATPNARLTVSLHGQSALTTSDRLGEWSAFLKPETAGGPYTLAIRGDVQEEQQLVQDILIGDVWIASGQSNMAMPLAGFPGSAPIKDGPAEIKAATNPRLRLLRVTENSSDYPMKDIKDTWTQCSPETAANISAVGYFFSREVAAKEQVPIGLIQAAWGGVPIDSFISLDGLTTTQAVASVFANRASFASKIAQQEATVAAEKKEDANAKSAGKAAPEHDWHPHGVSWLPAGPYNSMIAPLTGYTIRGFLWYQGETDTSPERAPSYADLFRTLIFDWRSHFAQGDLPFIFAQISSYKGGPGWGVVRDAQRRTLAVAHTAMAPTLDVGEAENIHPADKQTVGLRMAESALSMVYAKGVSYDLPLFREATTEPGAIRAWFDQSKGLKVVGKIEGFEVAGADHAFRKAEATIDGETIVVTSSAVSQPQFVRYAWDGIAPKPVYNAAGLPISTFTSESKPRP